MKISLIFLMPISFALMFTSVVFGAESPFQCRTQKVDVNCQPGWLNCSPVWATNIVCDVTADNIHVSNVVLNRGRCQTDFSSNRTYNYGDQIVINAGLCNLLEFSIEANNNNWTWGTHGE